MHGVYKYEYNGEVIYVGKTDHSFSQRLYCHSTDPLFEPYLSDVQIFVCELNSERETDFLETLLINQYKPILNRMKKNVTIVPVSAGLNWISWLEYKDSFNQKERCQDGKSYGFYLSDEAVSKLEKLAKQNKCSKSKALDTLLRSVL